MHTRLIIRPCRSSTHFFRIVVLTPQVNIEAFGIGVPVDCSWIFAIVFFSTRLKITIYKNYCNQLKKKNKNKNTNRYLTNSMRKIPKIRILSKMQKLTIVWTHEAPTTFNIFTEQLEDFKSRKCRSNKNLHRRRSIVKLKLNFSSWRQVFTDRCTRISANEW